MNIALRITLLIAVLLYFVCIGFLLKKKSLALKYTLLWLLTGFVMLLCLIFPNVLGKILHLIGIVEMTNGLFALVLFALMIICVSITSIVSKMNERTRQLVQQCAMYEKRIRELEDKIGK